MLLALMCGCSTAAQAQKNQENQEFRHPTCTLSEQSAQLVQSQMDQSGEGKIAVEYCGALAEPDEMLGIALVEATLPLPNGDVRHTFFILKFANDGSKWVLLAEPEGIVDFVHESPSVSSETENSTLRL
jgi:hypothetical protein